MVSWATLVKEAVVLSDLLIRSGMVPEKLNVPSDMKRTNLYFLS
jgi:hypothetical protein